MSLTKGEQLSEYVKCATNYSYYAEKYCQVYDLTSGGFKNFELFEKQKELIKAYKKHRYNIVLKPRQAGVSTTTALHCAATILFANVKKPEKILIIANKRDTAVEFLKKIKSFINSAPQWMFNGESPITKDNEGYIELINGSAAKAVATSEDAFRGFTPTLMIMDEAAFIEGGGEVWTAALPALSTGGGAILISTPNGYDELYHAIYKGAKEKKNKFNVVEMRWYEDPRFSKDLKWVRGDTELIEFDKTKFPSLIAEGYLPTSGWFEDMCKQYNGDQRKIAQELLCDFLGSGDNVVKEEYIIQQEKTNVRLPIRTEGFDNNVWVWEEPIDKCQYILGADVSRGDSTDFSTIIILKVDTGEQVLEYQGKMPPDVLAEYIYKYGNLYQAHSVIDITGGLGQATVIKLLDMGYEYMHYSDPKSSKYVRDRMSKYVKRELIPGFMIGANRSLVIQEIERSIRMGEVSIRSQRLINELRTFVFLNGRPDHMKGNHDDLIWAFAMPLFVAQHSFKSLKKYNEQTKAMLESWGMIETPQQNISPLPNMNINVNGNAITPDSVKQFSWLFKK